MIFIRIEGPAGVLKLGRNVETMQVHFIVESGDGTKSPQEFTVTVDEWNQIVKVL